MQLTQSQQEALKEVRNFLLSKDKELIITGPSGSGKTTLIKTIKKKVFPEINALNKMLGRNIQHSLFLTATTNRAKEVLSKVCKVPANTIYSALNLKIYDNPISGKSEIDGRKFFRDIWQKGIVFLIDECSMIDSDLYKYISKLDHKIIYVGDKDQLPPVKDNFSIFNLGIKEISLDTPVRYPSQILQELASQLRETVESGLWNPIQIPKSNNLIWLNPKEAEEEIKRVFKTPTNNARILTYTNNQAIAYNDYINKLRGNKDYYIKGEKYLLNNYVTGFTADSVVKIDYLNPSLTKTIVETYPNIKETLDLIPVRVTAKGKYAQGFVPSDTSQYKRVLNRLANLGNWKLYFKLKNEVLDLRKLDACTIHKSQGSTFDTVFIDLNDLFTCRDENVLARLMYVACTRASSRVVLFGDIPRKYGGIIQCDK